MDDVCEAFKSFFPHQKKFRELCSRNFFIQAAGLAWNHAPACMESPWAHGIIEDAFPLRLDSIRDFVAIPYRSKLRIPCTALP
jgi:hypothetical protein